MAQLKAVPTIGSRACSTNWPDHTSKGSPVPVDESVIRAMLTKALGDDRASNLLSHPAGRRHRRHRRGLKWMDAPTVADLIKNEHPQIIATILVHLEFGPRRRDSRAFHRTPAQRRSAAHRHARRRAAGGAAELNDAMKRLLAGASGNVKKASMGGVRHAAEIPSTSSARRRKRPSSTTSANTTQDLAQKIILDEMFVFENLLDIDDRGIPAAAARDPESIR